MKKKLSFITAVALAALTLTPMSSSAASEIGISPDSLDDIIPESWVIDSEADLDKYVELTSMGEKFIKLDPKLNESFRIKWEDDSTFKAPTKVYVSEDGRVVRYFCLVTDKPRSFITFADGVTAAEINEVLEQNFDPELVEYPKAPELNYLEYPCTSSEVDLTYDDKDYHELGADGQDKEMCALLKEKGLITDYIIWTERYWTYDSFSYDFLGFIVPTQQEKDLYENYKAAVDYITENDIGEIEYRKGERGLISDHSTQPTDCLEEATYMRVVLPEDMPLEKKFEINFDLREKFGMYRKSSPTSYSADYLCAKVVNAYDAVEGDANNDGELDIADATLILQSVGNGDKYQLSIQGAYNADIDGINGISVLDALEVQKIDAQLS